MKNCFVGDGRGNRIEVIDARGCAIDRVLVDVVEYDPRSARAFAGSHVFKFADLPNLYFDCQLQLCAKDQEGCSRLTVSLRWIFELCLKTILFCLRLP